MVFDAYARYYDLLYCDKDYVAEAEYVASHIRRHAPDAKRILELGCGTGTHAGHLARMGYSVHGVDLSAEMINRASIHHGKLPRGIAVRLRFEQGDVRNVRVSGAFDAVISLFHVMSYQTSNDDIEGAFTTAATHLRRGGIFIFDFWYGPAVLTQKPEVRVKRLADEKVDIIRIAEPEMYPNENRVDVHYQVLIKEKSTGKVKILEETHRMRYLFMPEILGLCEEFGFSMLDAREWMTGKPPGLDTWSVYFVVGA